MVSYTGIFVFSEIIYHPFKEKVRYRIVSCKALEIYLIPIEKYGLFALLPLSDT